MQLTTASSDKHTSGACSHTCHNGGNVSKKFPTIAAQITHQIIQNCSRDVPVSFGQLLAKIQPIK